VIQHIVLLKFKEEVSPARIQDLFALIGELQSLISGITNYKWGEYNSPEGLNKGFTHGFIMTFESVAARNAYLPHPEHERVKAVLLECIDDAVAFDFEA
jgi:hypothetical protein